LEKLSRAVEAASTNASRLSRLVVHAGQFLGVRGPVRALLKADSVAATTGALFAKAWSSPPEHAAKPLNRRKKQSIAFLEIHQQSSLHGWQIPIQQRPNTGI